MSTLHVDQDAVADFFAVHETLRCIVRRRYPPRPIVRRRGMAVPIAISLADHRGLRPSGIPHNSPRGARFAPTIKATTNTEAACAHPTS